MRQHRKLAARVFKLFRLLPVPAWRRGLRRGVAATVEHDQVTFASDFRGVLDVGAHRGQFALFVLHRFPGVRLYCFEPLSDAGATLGSVLADYPEARIFPVALGSRTGQATMHVARRDDSSSLLPPTERQTEAFPGTEEATQTTVEMTCLDDILTGADPLPRPCLLKIDVQGNELEVLRGAVATLDLVDEVLVECSFAELYSGQARADEVVAFLGSRDFGLAGVFSITSDSLGRQLQGDFLFARSSGSR